MWKNKIDAIYTIFYRQFEKCKEDVPYLSKTYSINNKFKAELFEKENCMYKIDKCIAINRRIAIDNTKRGEEHEDSRTEI